ncbi:MAG: hypothetical protein KIT58_01545 [Planctomycetota bacterium]|nr:hypothetical protein [Planctomycetota bacterium]
MPSGTLAGRAAARPTARVAPAGRARADQPQAALGGPLGGLVLVDDARGHDPREALGSSRALLDGALALALGSSSYGRGDLLLAAAASGAWRGSGRTTWPRSRTSSRRRSRASAP